VRLGPASAGVIGWPVAHSKSPLIHRFWLGKLGLDGDYGRFPVEPARLGEAIRALPALGLRGVNLTVPHKETAIPFLDEVDPLAARAGAVNTVVVAEGGRLVGYNTDVAGVVEPLFGLGLEGARVALIGSGGAARAAVLALLELGAGPILIQNRSTERAGGLLEELGARGDVAPLGSPLPDVALVVNCSPLGMVGQPALSFDLGALGPAAAVFDMVYAPLETPLLAAARRRGLRTIDGLSMLIGQAAAAFERFFGARAPREHDRELRALLTA
jgi:shikimate dehydrogenase